MPSIDCVKTRGDGKRTTARARGRQAYDSKGAGTASVRQQEGTGNGTYDISGHSAEPFFTSANSGVLTGGPDANALVIAAIPRQTLRRGRPSEPHPAVTLHTASGDQPLVENVDYRLSWRHNTQKGTAVVVARGCGRLSGLVATAEFEVAGPNGLVFYLK